MISAILLFLIGVGLSAYFSGSETGYYRATRARLAMDAASGNRTARGLIWLANNPVLFVATVLVGNNLANYLVSHAIVTGTRTLVQEQFVLELLAPIVFTPFVFVYGELLPKDLFFKAPNRLLRAGGGFFLICCVLFLPITMMLWLLGRLLAFLLGEAPERLRASIARTELQRLFDEGEDSGLLKPAQRELAQSMFNLANRPLENLCIPSTRMPTVHMQDTKADAFRLANRYRSSHVLVMERTTRKLLGYVRVVDLFLHSNDRIEEARALLEVPVESSPISALMLLRSKRESLARVVDKQNQTVGIVDLRDLSRIVWSNSS